MNQLKNHSAIKRIIFEKQKLSDLFFNPDELNELGRTLRKKGKIFNKEIRVKRADGTPFWIMTSIRRISYMNTPAYLIAAIDITETKETPG